MRRPLHACRTGLTVVTAALLLSACGGSNGDSAAPSRSTTPSASQSSAGSEFCTQAAEVEKRIGAAFSGTSDPAKLPSVLQEAAGQIRAIDPPEELRADWSAFADGIEQVAAAARVDPSDPNAAAEFQRKVSEVQKQYGEAFTHVETYLAQNCGLGSTSPEPTSPTS